jgi:PQQ-like domain
MRGFAQRGLLILLSLFLFDLGARCPRSLSSISSIIWLECHGDPRGLIPKARGIFYQFLSDAYDSQKPPASQSSQALAKVLNEGGPDPTPPRNVKGATTMGAFQIILLAGIATLAVGGGSLAQTVSGPSMEDLLNADNDSANWILPAHNYSANRQIEESEIGPQNVDQMKVAWTFKLPGNDPVETAPIVWDGTVYVTSGRDDVFALDAKTGEVKWQHRPNSHATVAPPYTMGWSLSA